jgi:hypothetical protein
MQNIYSIQPISANFGPIASLTATKVSIACMYELFAKELPLRYMLLTEGHEVVYSGTIVLNEDEINAWGSNDNYIVDLVFSKVGLTKA